MSDGNLVIERENGWLQVQVPLPYSLKWVNAYLLPGDGDDDWSLIDPGLHTEEAVRVWEAVMRDRRLAWEQIARIVLTHHHPDHYGLAGWFQARTGAPVWMSEQAHATARWMWGSGGGGSEGDEGGISNGGSSGDEGSLSGNGGKREGGEVGGSMSGNGGKHGNGEGEGSMSGNGGTREGGEGGGSDGGQGSGSNEAGGNGSGRSEGFVSSVNVALLAAFRAHGLPESLADEMRTHLFGFVARVSPQPASVSYLRPGSTIRMAGAQWELIAGEGHAPGHLSFYDRAGGRILCGDQVLPDITPNIGWLPGGDPDPLGAYIGSLRAMRGLDVTWAYPGHRQPFREFGERVVELEQHHERRLERIADLIRERPACSFEVCERLFGERLRGNIHNLRFALSETIAHLVLLERRDVLLLGDDMKWVSRKT